MYHINALLNNEEWIAVLEASIAGVAMDKCSDKLEPHTVEIALRPEEALSSGQAGASTTTVLANS